MEKEIIRFDQSLTRQSDQGRLTTMGVMDKFLNYMKLNPDDDDEYADDDYYDEDDEEDEDE